MLAGVRVALLSAVVLLPSAPAVADPAPCDVAEAEYATTASLELRDTPMGRGNGTFAIGPGRTVLRFDKNKGTVEMLDYTMHESFSVRAKTVVWTTTVTTRADSRATPDPCGVVAKGTLVGSTVHWSTPMREYRTDGTLVCAGSFCGTFGVPPAGESQLHVGPAPQRLSDFVFSPDMKTFTMARTPGQKTETPKQTSAVSVSGRLVRRTCSKAPACAR